MTGPAGGGTTPRRTRQQQMVRDVLSAERRFLSARETHEILSGGGVSIGTSTVFRILRLLSQAGQAEVVTDERGRHRYLTALPESNHHFLVCRHCGRSIRIETDVVMSALVPLARRRRFTDVTCHIVVFGSCPQCAESPESGRVQPHPEQC